MIVVELVAAPVPVRADTRFSSSEGAEVQMASADLLGEPTARVLEVLADESRRTAQQGPRWESRFKWRRRAAIDAFVQGREGAP